MCSARRAAPPAATTVAVLVPVLNEERSLARCLSAVLSQSVRPQEIYVIDGNSTDRSREIAARFPCVTVLDNPGRLQACGLNIGLRAATSDVIVRVDGHSVLAPRYIERCVDSLGQDGVAMVGGMMKPVGRGWAQRGIARAMASRFGAGPAKFHVGGPPGWVDTVYLGAFRRRDAITIGGYAETFVANEDAEFAHRMQTMGGIWFDPAISATYEPRADFAQLGRQFFRYGGGRAATVWRHPRSLSPRQVAAPTLLLALLSPARRPVFTAYALAIAGLAALEFRRDGTEPSAFAIALPVMHLSWGSGFIIGMLRELWAGRR